MEFKPKYIWLQFSDQTFGRIDTLVLNHAILPTFEQYEDNPNRLDDLRTLFDVNFLSYVNAVDHAAPFLEKSGGSVVILSSQVGESLALI